LEVGVRSPAQTIGIAGCPIVFVLTGGANTKLRHQRKLRAIFERRLER
jgi:hypothetical protein